MSYMPKYISNSLIWKKMDVSENNIYNANIYVGYYKFISGHDIFIDLI